LDRTKNGQRCSNFFVEKAFEELSASVGYSASHSDNLPNRNYPFQSIQNPPSSTLSGWRTSVHLQQRHAESCQRAGEEPVAAGERIVAPFAGTLAGATVLNT
jgi:hypothetical protein